MPENSLLGVYKRTMANQRPTLVFSISALNLLMDVLLNISLKDSRSSRLVEACSLQDVCRIDPVVVPPSHHMLFEICAELELVHGNLQGAY